MITDIKSNTVNTDAVELIEGLLERLKSGDAVAVAFVEVKRGRTVAVASVGTHEGSYHYLNSGAAMLLHNLARSNE